ncbi:MAG: ARC6/PARC6 family protein [Leptolyngbyaceae cyanobacterium bins.59]|nr:ARC6/PARC6 family protein [Leptolyngbyaceae cyanobacterium bins.59]
MSRSDSSPKVSSASARSPIHTPASPQSFRLPKTPSTNSSIPPVAQTPVAQTPVARTPVVSPGRSRQSLPADDSETFPHQTFSRIPHKGQRRRRQTIWPAGMTTLAMMIVVAMSAAALAYSLKSLVRPPTLKETLPTESTSPLPPLPPDAEIARKPSMSGPSATPQGSAPRQNELLTQEVALLAVENWLKAKQEIFGPSYDSSSLEKVATGKFQVKALQSLEWLKQNQASYNYRSGKIVSYTPPQENQMTLTIEEEVELLTQTGLDPTRSGKKVTTVTYTFEQVDGVWKIAGSAAE